MESFATSAYSGQYGPGASYSSPNARRPPYENARGRGRGVYTQSRERTNMDYGQPASSPSRLESTGGRYEQVTRNGGNVQTVPGYTKPRNPPTAPASHAGSRTSNADQGFLNGTNSRIPPTAPSAPASARPETPSLGSIPSATRSHFSINSALPPSSPANPNALDSLEKLRQFKANVEASRQKKMAKDVEPNKLAQLAENFLMARKPELEPGEVPETPTGTDRSAATDAASREQALREKLKSRKSRESVPVSSAAKRERLSSGTIPGLPRRPKSLTPEPAEPSPNTIAEKLRRAQAWTQLNVPTPQNPRGPSANGTLRSIGTQGQSKPHAAQFTTESSSGRLNFVPSRHHHMNEEDGYGRIEDKRRRSTSPARLALRDRISPVKESRPDYKASAPIASEPARQRASGFDNPEPMRPRVVEYRRSSSPRKKRHPSRSRSPSREPYRSQPSRPSETFTSRSRRDSDTRSKPRHSHHIGESDSQANHHHDYRSRNSRQDDRKPDHSQGTRERHEERQSNCGFKYQERPSSPKPHGRTSAVAASKNDYQPRYQQHQPSQPQGIQHYPQLIQAPSQQQHIPIPPANGTDDVLATLAALKDQIARLEAQIPPAAPAPAHQANQPQAVTAYYFPDNTGVPYVAHVNPDGTQQLVPASTFPVQGQMLPPSQPVPTPGMAQIYVPQPLSQPQNLVYAAPQPIATQQYVPPASLKTESYNYGYTQATANAEASRGAMHTDRLAHISGSRHHQDDRTPSRASESYPGRYQDSGYDRVPRSGTSTTDRGYDSRSSRPTPNQMQEPPRHRVYSGESSRGGRGGRGGSSRGRGGFDNRARGGFDNRGRGRGRGGGGY